MRKRQLAILLMLAAIAALCILGEIQDSREAPAVYSTGRNGLWLRHDWVGRKKTPADYARLAGMLRELQITDAYFHAGPLRADGSIDPSKILFAADLLASLRRLAPEVRVQAWLG